MDLSDLNRLNEDLSDQGGRADLVGAAPHGPSGPHAILPERYDADDAEEDRRNLATLSDPSVSWRTKRRLRHRVGDEEELAARLVAWEAQQPSEPLPASEAVRVLEADAVALAREYHQVCSALYGRHDADVLANARRIAAGDVLPWEARAVIAAERERLEARDRTEQHVEAR